MKFAGVVSILKSLSCTRRLHPLLGGLSTENDDSCWDVPYVGNLVSVGTFFVRVVCCVLFFWGGTAFFGLFQQEKKN